METAHATKCDKQSVCFQTVFPIWISIKNTLIITENMTNKRIDIRSNKKYIVEIKIPVSGIGRIRLRMGTQKETSNLPSCY